MPLLVVIAEQPPGPTGRWNATRAGILTGVVHFGVLLYWIVPALLPESPLAVAAWVLTVLLLGGFVGAFAWATHYVTERLALPLVLTAPLLWTTLEWLPEQLGDLAYPWLGLGYALAPFPVLAGAADLVGARGLTLWIAAVNGLLAMAILRARSGSGTELRTTPGTEPGTVAVTARLAGVVILLAVPAGYGAWRAVTLETRPAARVAVVQPNIAQAVRRDHGLATDTALVELVRLTREVTATAEDGGAHDRVDLVAWPEVALMTDLKADTPRLDAVRALSAAAGAPILAGAFGADPGRPGARHNSAVLVASSGVAGPRYDKRRLVPFIERRPFRRATGGPEPAARVAHGPEPGASAARAGASHRGGLEPGRLGPILQAETGGAFGVLICYESAFRDLARQYRRDGADFLVNITNDAWFGGGPGRRVTAAHWQHPAHAVMRAIENRVGVVRAANTGRSMFIDPRGRVRDAAPAFVAAAHADVVLTTDGTTLYARWGDWLAALAAAAAAALLLAAWRWGAGGSPPWARRK